MARRWVSTRYDGMLIVTVFTSDNPTEQEIAKTMFELSRRGGNDSDTHFDPAIHTLSAIAAGLPNHKPIDSHEIDSSELPTDRYFRAAWEWSE